MGLFNFNRQIMNNTDDDLKLLLGNISSKINLSLNSDNIADYEFKVFSQFGDDGIIQHLVHTIKPVNKTFIEFGVEDYLESNTRFLLMNDNWSGFVIEADANKFKKIVSSKNFWKYDLKAENHFVTKGNVNELLGRHGFRNLGLLSIDIDGMDYWIWKEIICTDLNPSIVIIEYNSVFGNERKISVPYKADFARSDAHYSNLYWGASLGALVNLSKEKGYKFIGCNTAGNNAYFVRNDIISIKEISLRDGFVQSKFRESRNSNGQLTYLTGEDRLSEIKGLPVVNVSENKIEEI